MPGVLQHAAWAKASRCMPFAIPMVWREPTDHVSDCCFCLTSLTGVTAKSKHTVQYPNLPSAMRPVAHSAGLLCQTVLGYCAKQCWVTVPNSAGLLCQTVLGYCAKQCWVT